MELFSKSDLRKLIVPLILEQVLAMLVGLCDTVMVSNVGEAAVSGVSLVDMLNQLAITVFAALATGGAVIASQYIGHKNQKKACESAMHSETDVFSSASSFPIIYTDILTMPLPLQ